MSKPQKYPVGFRFIPRSNRKSRRVATITHFLTVTDQNGSVVKTYYKGVSHLMGMPIEVTDIAQTTMDMAEHITDNGTLS